MVNILRDGSNYSSKEDYSWLKECSLLFQLGMTQNVRKELGREEFRIITSETVSMDWNETISHWKRPNGVQWTPATQFAIPSPFFLLPPPSSIFFLFLDVEFSLTKLSLVWIILLLSELCALLLCCGLWQEEISPQIYFYGYFISRPGSSLIFP